MENRFKKRFSRIFRSSFGSCRPRDITVEVIEKPRPIFLPGNSPQRHHRNHHQQLIQLFSPKPPRSFPSSGGSKCSPVSQPEGQKSPLAILTETAAAEGQKCPPVSPISPLLNSFYWKPDHDRLCRSAPKPKDNKSKKSRKPTTGKFHRSRSNSFGLNDEFAAFSYNGLFSSDEEDDKTKLFSSRSLSSDSSDSLRRNRSCRSTNPKNNHHHRQKRVVCGGGAKDDWEIMGGCRPTTTAVEGLMVEGSKVKDSFAVVKRSSDPYNDFRTSMVEMIVERQIFSADELEKLLQCFLSLNSYPHHNIIVEVFTEICESLFSDWS